MNLKETGYKSVDWIHLTQDRDQWWELVNAVIIRYVAEMEGGGGCWAA